MERSIGNKRMERTKRLLGRIGILWSIWSIGLLGVVWLVGLDRNFWMERVVGLERSIWLLGILGGVGLVGTIWILRHQRTERD